MPFIVRTTLANVLLKPLKEAAKAARVNLVPALLLQGFALGLVFLYYFYAPSRPVFNIIAGLKTRYGYFYSMASTAFFAGVLPFIFLRIQRATRRHAAVRHLPFLLLFWAAKGAEVDLLYRLQAYFFGTDVSWSVVLPKIFVDQFVYMTIWGGPTMVVLLFWKDSEYRFDKVKGILNRRCYPDRIFPVIVSNWGVWIPAVAFVYCLPLPLQLPIENIVLCFWVLILTLLTRPMAEEQKA
jgi:hypothetical protein